MRFNTEISILD